MRSTSIVEKHWAVTTQFMVQSAKENIISLMAQRSEAHALFGSAHTERVIADASIGERLISLTRSQPGKANWSHRIIPNAKNIYATKQIAALQTAIRAFDFVYVDRSTVGYQANSNVGAMWLNQASAADGRRPPRSIFLVCSHSMRCDDYNIKLAVP